MIYTHAAAALLGASIAAVGAYKVQDWRYTGQINQIKAAQAEAVKNSASETIWCSPHCMPERGVVVDLFAEAA